MWVNKLIHDKRLWLKGSMVAVILIVMSLAFTACDSWDLDTGDFPEVATGSFQIGALPTEAILEGTISGLGPGGSVEDYGHTWSSVTPMPSLLDKEGLSSLGKTGQQFLSKPD